MQEGSLNKSISAGLFIQAWTPIAQWLHEHWLAYENKLAAFHAGHDQQLQKAIIEGWGRACGVLPPPLVDSSESESDSDPIPPEFPAAIQASLVDIIEVRAFRFHTSDDIDRFFSLLHGLPVRVMRASSDTTMPSGEGQL